MLSLSLFSWTAAPHSSLLPHSDNEHHDFPPRLGGKMLSSDFLFDMSDCMWANSPDNISAYSTEEKQVLHCHK